MAVCLWKITVVAVFMGLVVPAFIGWYEKKSNEKWRATFGNKSYKAAQKAPWSREVIQGFNIHYLPQEYFRWGQYFLAPNAFFMSLRLTWILGLPFYDHTCPSCVPSYKQPMRDQNKLVFDLVMGTSLVQEVDLTTQDMAKFTYYDVQVPYADQEFFSVYPSLVLTLDIKVGIFRSAFTIDSNGTNRTRNAADTVVLLVQYLALSGHIRIHAQGNGAVNLHSRDAEMVRNSIVTILYNSYGDTTTWQWLKAGVADGSEQASMINRTLKSRFSDWTRAKSLDRHSDLVFFIIEMQRIFKELFSKERYYDSLEGIRQDDLFVATIVHSLDHFSINRILANPWDLDPTDPDLFYAAHGARVGIVGFSQVPPFLSFKTKIKDAREGSFFKDLYETAMKEISTTLCPDAPVYLSEIRTCIVM